MTPNNANIRQFLFLFILALSFFAGCQCDFQQPTAEFVADASKGPVHSIAAKNYGKASIPARDTLELTFPCIATAPQAEPGLGFEVSGNTVRLWLSKQQTQTAGFTSLSSTPIRMARFTAPAYTLKLQAAPSSSTITVRAGDANADGRIDMLDVFPIAQGIRKYGLATLPGGNSPATVSPNQTIQRTPTGDTWTWSGASAPIDFVHADCNMDGIISDEDLIFLQPALQPLLLPNMLQAAYSGIQLEAVQNHPIEVYPYLDAQNQQRAEVRAWYDIRVRQSVNAGGDSILGVVFTRPVAEDPGVYTVLNIQASSAYSQLIPNNSQMLEHQHYWDGIGIQVPDSCNGPKAVSKPLDVAVFNMSDLKHMQPTDCITSCGVTIDDMLRITGGQVTHIYQHLMNVVLFRQAADGTIYAETTSCSFDAVDLSNKRVRTYTADNLPDNWWSNGHDPNRSPLAKK